MITKNMRKTSFHHYQLLPRDHTSDCFIQEFNIASSSNEEITEELQKLTRLKIRVFVVHVSHLLAPSLFLSANKLGMMSEGYAWIGNSSSVNLLQSMNFAVIESIQAVLGFKSSIPASINLHSLTTRLKRKFYMEDPDIEAI
ncbi:putative periplasmic binding protein-like I [Rosa chinensis]|uniref:Putative periplasmic binding protein-like I n=1 Tax=Rosa chinensis TaxID=74649 RepID=A0A2P6SDT6_ROSCH|nr:putative periplasmic binding protein-like I [Rosa chinensis]